MTPMRPFIVLVPVLAILVSGCMTAATSDRTAASDSTAAVSAPSVSKRSLASYRQPASAQQCYDRSREPYTAVVDVHFHPRPFGGPAKTPQQLFETFDRSGVRFVNYFGIGQVLELSSGCSYYLDCPGVTAMPSIKNDFANGLDMAAYQHDNVNVVLSMTFFDLAHPENAVDMIELYDREYPGMFKWAGELNVIKQALLGNNHEPATEESIDAWAPFMKILRERNIPVTLHSDLGSDANPTQYLHLMDHVLETYPDNKIVWAHMGLSKELQHMDPQRHVALMSERLDKYPNLMLDISWDVLFNAYHEWGAIFIDFFNRYPTRILPGSDFVAAATKSDDQYAKELDTTSRALKFLSNEAFRDIALGENYFRLLGIDYHAPQVCAGYTPPVPGQR